MIRSVPNSTVERNEVGSGQGFAWALAPHYHRDRLGDSLPCFRPVIRVFGMGTGPSSQLWPPTPLGPRLRKRLVKPSRKLVAERRPARRKVPVLRPLLLDNHSQDQQEENRADGDD